jgi:N-acetylglutamate synthase-like GNAT family acetyltransferase
MKRLHLHVSVRDLDAWIRFYTQLFATEPSVRKDDYAKWMLEDPTVNFAISQRDGKLGVQHLGIQVEDRGELEEVYARLQRAEGPVIEERTTTCCYAQSEKSWIEDPQGVRWETFLTIGASTVYGMTRSGPSRKSARPKRRVARRAAAPRAPHDLIEANVAELRAATEADLSVVRQLLEQAGLPTSDLAASKAQFTVLCENERIVAAGALERFGSTALLRSVVVAANRRGAGLGRIVVQELERLARAARIGPLILLTQSAAKFFAHEGYRVIVRIDAPQDVQGSEEFRSLCPTSATCMMKVLTDFE